MLVAANMPFTKKRASSCVNAAYGLGNTHNKLTCIVADLLHDEELRDAVLVLTISSAVALYLYMACKEHDVKQFYARHDTSKTMVVLFGVCSFVIWFSIAVNAKFICVWLFRNIFL